MNPKVSQEMDSFVPIVMVFGNSCSNLKLDFGNMNFEFKGLSDKKARDNGAHR